MDTKSIEHTLHAFLKFFEVQCSVVVMIVSLEDLINWDGDFSWKMLFLVGIVEVQGVHVGEVGP